MALPYPNPSLSHSTPSRKYQEMPTHSSEEMMSELMSKAQFHLLCYNLGEYWVVSRK